MVHKSKSFHKIPVEAFAQVTISDLIFEMWVCVCMCMHRQLTSSPVHTGVDYIWIKMLGKVFHFHTTSSLLTTCPAPRTYISLFSQQKILIFRHLSAITLESFLSWSVGKNYLWEGSSKWIYFCSSVVFFFFSYCSLQCPVGSPRCLGDTEAGVAHKGASGHCKSPI